ncbi:MAG: DUF2149 domain-containing protein [Clostridiales bacterium]|nr:DUF2149 domain-containing protein [Clostridiales bacterium]
MRVAGKSGRLRINRKKDEINPMDGLANMADVMLVFACGLLIALVVNWNVDINTLSDSDVPEKAKYEVEDIQEEASEEVTDKGRLEELGKVYRDPDTGKYYVIDE